MSAAGESGKKRTILIEIWKALGVLIILALLMMWLSGTFTSKVKPGPPLPRDETPGLDTQKVSRRVFPLVVEQVGTIRAHTEANVSSRIMAQVIEIFVREGDMVLGSDAKEGEQTIMARLDDGDIKARLGQAKSQVKGAERAIEVARARLVATRAQVRGARANREKVVSDYRRFQELQRSQAATTQQLEHARMQKDVAEAQLEALLQDVHGAESEIARAQAQREQAEAAAAEARAMLSYTLIHAPFTGRVIKKMVDVGDMATPGRPLFFVEVSTRPELHASVSESLMPYIRVGQDLSVRIDALERTVRGKVREIMPLSDPSTRTFQVKVSLPADPEFVNGLFGRLEIPHGEYDSLMIPVKAVREVGQLHLVDVLDSGGNALRRFVTLGRLRANEVEVLSGLKENEEVVIHE